MQLNLIRTMVLVMLATWTASAFALTAKIDTQSAKAVIAALQNTSLSYGEAMKAAALPGNQGIIRKLNEFKIPATTELFARALMAEAQGVAVQNQVEKSFAFHTVKAKIPQLQAFLAKVESDPVAFQGAIEERIALYSPPDVNIKLIGYVVAGGDGAGYAFGDTNFYLNIGMADELAIVKSVTTHELYHAVQGAFKRYRGGVSTESLKVGATTFNACKETEKFFANVYEEGTAVEVADVRLLDNAVSEIGLHMLEDNIDHLKHLDVAATLMEMTVISLTAAQPISYDEVYAVDFWGHGTMYGISYIIAKSITDSDGPQGLASFLKKPPYQFLLRYTQLPSYGADAMHPKLGPNTINALHRLANNCA